MNKEEALIYTIITGMLASQVGCPVTKDDSKVEKVKQEVYEIYGPEWFNSDFAGEEERTTALEEMIKEFNTEIANAAEDLKLTSEELGKIGKFAETAGKYDVNKVPKRFKKAIIDIINNYKGLKAKFDKHGETDTFYVIMHKGKSICGTTFGGKNGNSITLDMNVKDAEEYFGKDVYQKLKEQAVESRALLRYIGLKDDGDKKVKAARESGEIYGLEVSDKRDEISELETKAGTTWKSESRDMSKKQRNKNKSWTSYLGVLKNIFKYGKKDAEAMQVKYPAEEAKQ
ncbi:hypothetical protein KY332_03535 [Candidatus Woesearchaeota archaeon]|nr:hypothetical protein [Candidatus Woesearchaeota archaeon]